MASNQTSAGRAPGSSMRTPSSPGRLAASALRRWRPPLVRRASSREGPRSLELPGPPEARPCPRNAGTALTYRRSEGSTSSGALPKRPRRRVSRPRVTPSRVSATFGMTRATAVETLRDDGSVQTPNQGDLWNPASVSRSWEVNEGRKASPLGGLLFGESSGGGIWY